MKCVICESVKKWLPQCDECGEHFCPEHLKDMEGVGYQLCGNCVIENSGAGSESNG